MAPFEIQQTFAVAIQHHQAGRLQEAEQLYRRILAQEPKHAGALHYLGMIAYRKGQHETAVELIRQAIALMPNWPEAHSNLASVRQAMGQLQPAIAAYRRAIALNPDYPEVHYNLGTALQAAGQLDQAIAAWRQAIALRPDFPEAYYNLGNAFQEQKRFDEAIAAHRQAIALRPNYPEALNNLGNALQATKCLDEAIAAHRQAVALKPDFADAHYNLAIALHAAEQLDQAIAAYRQAIVLKPNAAIIHNDLANALANKGNPAEAATAYRQAIALDPNLAGAHWNLALALLVQGDFRQGWKEYEWRWRWDDFAAYQRGFMQPQWDGSPLAGRTLLLHAEQGFGDTIQFLRYLPLVAQRGQRVIFECQRELLPLVRPMAGDISVVERGLPLPSFDIHCPLLSLPNIMGTTLESIPRNVPYLRADAPNAETWRSRLAGQPVPLKVGLVWAGNRTHKNDRNRSLQWASLAPLAKIPGVQFYSLQKGEAAAEAKTPPPGMAWIDHSADLKDFGDTAALIANLDLVIAVDTSVAHLAGALGKPVWTLLPHVPDWRWLLKREDCPWYPTMRLFRQPAVGDWNSVIQQVAAALADLAHRA